MKLQETLSIPDSTESPQYFGRARVRFRAPSFAAERVTRALRGLPREVLATFHAERALPRLRPLPREPLPGTRARSVGVWVTAGASRPGGRGRPGPHLAAVLLLLLQQLGNRGHGDAGLERGRLAVRGEKRLDRRRRQGSSRGRPRPRLRQPLCPTAAGGLATPPPSQQPQERRAAPHVLPQGSLPRPRCRPSWSRAKKLRGAYPRSEPRRSRQPPAATGTRCPLHPANEALLKKGCALLGGGNLLFSQSPRWRRALT